MTRQFKRPKVLISNYRGDCKCRYDGLNVKSPFVEVLKPFVDFSTVCPEVPRQALRIISPKGEDESLVFSKTGEDMTKEMESFTNKYKEKYKYVTSIIWILL